MSEQNQANSEQIVYWNDVGGLKWVRYAELLDEQLRAVGAAAIDAARPGAGEIVLDVGCGCGSTTLSLAKHVGVLGRCTGIDISRPMLDLATQRAEVEGLTNTNFTEADAQTHAFEPAYDLCFSRFGVMFFENPTLAFTNLHRALRRHGRLAFVCWQALHRNDWMRIPMMAALQHVTIETPSSPEAPGPFAFADSERVKGILTEAGFCDVQVRGLDVELTIGGGGTAEEAVDFLFDLGPLSRILVDSTDEVKIAVRRDVLESISSFAGSAGVKMPGAVWIVTAKA